MKNFLVLCFFVLSTSCMAQHASFEALGFLPGGSPESAAQAISGDGSVVVGSSTTATGKHAFRWTKAEGMVDIGDTALKTSWAYNTSQNGSVVVGSGDAGSGWSTYKGFLWRNDQRLDHLDAFRDSSRYEFWGVSSDDSVIVGDGGRQAFRWTEETGVVFLGVLPDRTSSRAVSVSADGSVIAGSSYNLPAWDHEQAFRWTSKEGMTGLGYLPGGSVSFATAVSPDGSVIAGTSTDSSGYCAFRWEIDSGMVRLGHLPGKNTTHPFAANDDGTMIVGSSFKGRKNGTAFIWDKNHGMRSLQDVLNTEYGLQLSGWVLQSATGISYDGTVIVGSGINPSGQQEAFRIMLKTH